ncbi:MAG: transcriptional regulator GutM [Candidatus Dormibacteraeota bacterium]|nr:transcriptional regulator GutM [Candidatus Dormibacteraeota bacterium]
MTGEGERLKDYGVWLAALGLAWVVQLVLSMRQMRRFYRRVNELKRLGRTTIGVGGGTYRGRAYAVVTADSVGRVLSAEVMSGISVFAGLRPLPDVKGWNVAALRETPPPSLNTKQRAALSQAADKLLKGGESAGSLGDLPAKLGPNNS